MFPEGFQRHALDCASPGAEWRVVALRLSVGLFRFCIEGQTKWDIYGKPVRKSPLTRTPLL